MASIARTSTGLEGAILIHPDGTVVTGTGTGGGGGSTSVWSAADAAANGMTLSNGGLTVTPSGAAGWSSIRNSISKASGKVYVEFSVTGTVSDPNNVLVGLASSSFGSGNYLGSSNYSCGMRQAGILCSTGFTDNGLGQIIFSGNPNDVLSIAVDFTAGSIWVACNNVWAGGGNPVAKLSPSISFTPAIVGDLFATMSFQSTPGVWTLQSTAASQKYAPPAGFSAWDSAAPSHSAEALAYLARTVGGNEGGNGANIATLIDGLVSDGVWAKLDCLYVLAQQNQSDARLNLVNASYPLTGTLRDQPSPRVSTFVQYVGFSFSSSYLDTNFNVVTATSPNFTQNSASFGVWSYTVVNENIGQIGNGATGSGSHIYDNFSGTSFYARINDSSAGSVPGPGTKGLFVADRSSAANSVPYWDGVSQGAVASTSGAPFNGDFVIGAVPGIVNSTAQTLSAAFIGASLGAAGQLALYNRLRTYMTAIGVP